MTHRIVSESTSVEKEFEFIACNCSPPSPSIEALEASYLFSDVDEAQECTESLSLCDESLPNFVAFRCAPLNESLFRSYFDAAGRLVDEHAFKTAVFRGGCEPGIRPEVWPYLFSFYSTVLTFVERQQLLEKQLHFYNALKSKWCEILLQAYPSFDFTQPDNCITDNRPAYEAFTNCRPSPLKVKENSDHKVAQLEARIIVQRIEVSVNCLLESLRQISKDVLRTDRSHNYFAGDDNSPHLLALRDALVTFCVLNPDVGYVQGMNDLLARFFIVLDDELLAFWCFNNYVQYIRDEFTSQGMLKKINLMSSLLKRLDHELYTFLQHRNLTDMVFCNKWLLLCFQREFDFEDGLRLLEIVCTRLIGVNSQLALKIVDDCRKATQDVDVNVECELAHNDYTFDLFISVAILVLNRHRILQPDLDDSDVVQELLQSPKATKLDNILNEAEKLFYLFCRRSVLYSF